MTLAVRKVDAGEKTAADIRASTGNPAVLVRHLDLSDQASVRTFVASWEGPLHILVNNAGIMALPTHERTGEGWEMQFATNYLGHFALTVGLHQPSRRRRRPYRIGQFERKSVRSGDLRRPQFRLSVV